MRILVNRSNEEHEPLDTTKDFMEGKRVDMFCSGGRTRDENGNFIHTFNCHKCRSTYSLDNEDYMTERFQEKVMGETFTCPVCGFFENQRSIQIALAHEYENMDIYKTITEGEFYLGQKIVNKWARAGKTCNGIPYKENHETFEEAKSRMSALDKDVISCKVYDTHKFSPRYDEIEWIDHAARDKAIKFYQEDGSAPMLNDYKLKNKMYVYDICERCGFVVNRKSQ
jgi:hypothetical protein